MFEIIKRDRRNEIALFKSHHKIEVTQIRAILQTTYYGRKVGKTLKGRS